MPEEAFTPIGGQTRNRIAALDASTGLATTWNPNASNAVNTIAINGSTVYVGGNFTSIGGQTRNRIAALDASTGLATAWNPNASNTVTTIAINGSTVYAGGTFTSIGGQTRNRIAALDAATGLATAWDPNAGSTVTVIAINGSTIYAGGNFSSIGGQTRNLIAALDASTGLATAWNPNAGNTVNTIAINGSTVYAGGSFTSIGGQTRNRIAALDASTGLATAWDPNAANTVSTIAVNGSSLFVGGSFGTIAGGPRFGLAVFSMGITLPVQLISFTATAQRATASNAAVLCNWKTATEENSSHFVVERSSNGGNFIPVGQVTANGNSSIQQSYTFIDKTSLKGISYYRLKQVDLDGKFTYSAIVMVTTSSSATLFTIYPNPAKEEATLAVSLNKKQNAVYSIFDQAGRKLVSEYCFPVRRSKYYRPAGKELTRRYLFYSIEG